MKQDQAIRRFKILADRNRLRIIQLLTKGPRTATAVATRLKIERTLVAHNLRLMQREGLLMSERAGKEVFYNVVPDLVVEKRDGLALELGCCQIKFH